MKTIRELLGFESEPGDEPRKPGDDSLDGILLHEDQKQKFETDRSLLESRSPDAEREVQREADRAVVSAAEDSLRQLHVIQQGRCPSCGAHLSRHLFASVCESCGWHSFDVPRQGPVRVYLQGRAEPIEGDRCYLAKPDSVLIVKDEAVHARINRSAVTWIEYGWTARELGQRNRQIVDQLKLLCGWCNGPADPDQDGFHMAQVAFGSTQERYTFCSDPCYEAFRKMYPARVHRDCYERDCSKCDLCIKRYDDESDSVLLLAKDYIQPRTRV